MRHMYDVAAATRAHIAKTTTKSSCYRCLDLNFQFSRVKNKDVVSAIEYKVLKGLSSLYLVQQSVSIVLCYHSGPNDDHPQNKQSQILLSTAKPYR